MKYLYTIKLETVNSFTEIARFTCSKLSTVSKKISELSKEYGVDTKPISNGFDMYGCLTFTNSLALDNTYILGKSNKKLWVFVKVL